ncbi:MAG: preprotein translocase subunit YajC [Planctomycetes bacterium]|nr:preprotein translocase subunit YajC [Planctomycetota bacterium]
MMIPFLLIGVLFYFMMIRPQRRQQKGLKDLLANLKKNDKVVTIGGIVGTVVIVEKDRPYVTLRVDEKSDTKIRLLRSSISRILTDEDELDKKDLGKGS